MPAKEQLVKPVSSIYIYTIYIVYIYILYIYIFFERSEYGSLLEKLKYTEANFESNMCFACLSCIRLSERHGVR